MRDCGERRMLTSVVWVATRTKVLANTLEDEGTASTVSCQCLKRSTHVLAQGRRERVEPCRVVELDDADACG